MSDATSTRSTELKRAQAEADRTNALADDWKYVNQAARACHVDRREVLRLIKAGKLAGGVEKVGRRRHRVRVAVLRTALYLDRQVRPAQRSAEAMTQRRAPRSTLHSEAST